MTNCQFLCCMSKQRNAAAPAKAGKTRSERKQSMFLHLGRIKVQIGPNKSTATAVAMVLLAVIAWAFAPFVTAAKLSMLYLIADNGKKSGRADGNVYMRNGRVRGFKVPALVQNAYTGTARSLLALFSSGWAALTQSERDTWLNVTNVFKSNRFGQQIPVKGKELFVQRNTNLNYIGASTISTYVDSEGVAGSLLTDGAVTVTAGLITTANIVFDPSPSDATVKHLVYATATLPAGVSRPKGSAYRLIGVMDASETSPFDVASMYTTKYGAIAAVGQKVGFKLVPINVTTGQAGVATVFVVEVN